jgi:hypothetical protein
VRLKNYWSRLSALQSLKITIPVALIGTASAVRLRPQPFDGRPTTNLPSNAASTWTDMSRRAALAGGLLDHLATDSHRPDEPHLGKCPGLNAPAASQYAATTPELLGWVGGYNARQPSGHKVFPFGFLLFLQAKSRIEMAKDEPDALSHELWRRREPRPAAP